MRGVGGSTAARQIFSLGGGRTGGGRARRGRALPLRTQGAAAPLRGRLHRLPAARRAARQAPGPAVALPDPDLHAGRAAHHRGASRPRAAARRVRHPARRPALGPGADHARGRAVRHPGGAAAARRAGAARPAGRRARRPRRARRSRPRRRVRRTTRPGTGRGRLAGAVRGAGRDPAPPGGRGARGGRAVPGRAGPGRRQPRGQLGLAATAPRGRRAARVGAGGRDRLERAPPDQPVPRRDRADAEGRRPGHQVRPGQEAAGAQPHRRRGAPATGSPTWPPTAATSTRPTWPGSSARWPAARRASGWPRSSETSKPGTG